MSYLNNLTKDGDIYLITSEDEFVGLSNYVNIGNDCNGLTFNLESDLDLSKIEHWTPIHTFNGTFDGKNHKISNLIIKKSYSDSVGLFGYVGDSGIIKNVNLLSANIETYANDVGGIAGRNDGIISNCNFVGKLSGRWNIGGIAGNNSKIIKHCKSDCTIKVSDGNAGGILGYGYGGDFKNGYGAVMGCYSAVKIIDENYYSCSNLGGITGYNPAGNFTIRGKKHSSSGWYYSEDPNLNGVGGGKGFDTTGRLYKISFYGEVTVNSSFHGGDASVDINGETYYKNGSMITVKGFEGIDVSGFGVTPKNNGNIIKVDEITIRFT